MVPVSRRRHCSAGWPTNGRAFTQHEVAMTTTASSIAMDFAPPEVLVERRPCGTMVFRSPWELAPFASTVGSLLDEAAADSPRATFLAERSGNGWREVSYAETRNQVRRIASSLLM